MANPENNNLESIIIDPKETATHSVIWLHGLGASGHDFLPVVKQFNKYDLLNKYNIRFIFPHAPKIPVSINNNYNMPAWFDIYGLDKNSKEDNIGLENSRQQINNIIHHETHKGVDYSNIILAGFSQGGALALYTGLKFEYRLAGMVGLSCYLPRFDQNYDQANYKTNIMLAHGNQDPVVLEEFGKQAYQRLLDLNYQVVWHSYPMQHQVCNQEIEDIELFISNNFNNNK